MDDGCCHGDNIRILLINRHMSYIVTADQIVSIAAFTRQGLIRIPIQNGLNP